MACGSCGQKKKVMGQWKITLPNGTVKTAVTELGAKMLAARYPGATYEKVS